MNLIYMAFGPNAKIHLQTAFSIYSFLRQKQFVNSINIVTDNEAFYNHLSSHVHIIKVTEDDLTAWKGEHQFFWRIKIKAIEKVCILYPNQPVVYLDCDTFLHGDLSVLNKILLNEKAFMHEDEGVLSAKTTKTQRNMWRQIAGKTFGNLLMQATGHMWNAGVVGTPNTHNGTDCKLALSICDEMCRQDVSRYFIEQYSLSLALEKMYGLVEAKMEIVHYWSTKEIWTNRIHDFFIEAYFAGWSYETILGKMQHFDTSALPIYQKVKTTNVRLKDWVDKMFANRNLEYLPKK